MLKFTTEQEYKKVMRPTISAPLIQVKDLSVADANGRIILHNINLTLNAGEIISVVGPNGAGKTTLVKTIVGLIKPVKGRIEQLPGLRIGYMPQRLHIEETFPLTVQRFLQLGNAGSKSQIHATLTEMGVQHTLTRPLQVLSGGEFQRVLLARALLRQPQLLVLDEPAQGVDLIGQGELYDLIAKLRHDHHCTILLVSHDLNVVMGQTDMVVCLNQHICCSGHPDKVSRDPAFTALFGKAVQGLAFYTHRHDHHHDVQGEVISGVKDHHHHE